MTGRNLLIKASLFLTVFSSYPFGEKKRVYNWLALPFQPTELSLETNAFSKHSNSAVPAHPQWERPGTAGSCSSQSSQGAEHGLLVWQVYRFPTCKSCWSLSFSQQLYPEIHFQKGCFFAACNAFGDISTCPAGQIGIGHLALRWIMLNRCTQPMLKQ